MTLIAGTISVTSATNTTYTPEEFLGNITNIHNGDIITISNGTADVSHEYTIDTSDIIIKTDGTVTFKGITSASHFTINGNNVTIEGITFIKFNNTNRDGGTLSWIGNNGKIINCNFANNNGYTGGAIYGYGNSCTIENCKFINNSAELGGGAIYLMGLESKILKCNFTNNTCTGNSYGGGGGAICLCTDNTRLEHCTFINNTSKYNGGAIEGYGNNNVVQNCNFTDNHVNHEKCQSGDGQGGAICWYHGSKNIAMDSVFDKNTAQYGGAIEWYSNAYGITFNCTFTNNADRIGNIVDIYGIKTDCYVIDCKFQNNTKLYPWR